MRAAADYSGDNQWSCPPHSSTRQRSRGLAGSRVGRVPRPSGYRAAFPRACTAAM